MQRACPGRLLRKIGCTLVLKYSKSSVDRVGAAGCCPNAPTVNKAKQPKVNAATFLNTTPSFEKVIGRPAKAGLYVRASTYVASTYVASTYVASTYVGAAFRRP